MDAIDDVMILSHGGETNACETRFMEITTGPGAAEVVATLGFAQAYPIKPSTGSRTGAKYRAVRGNAIANQVGKRVTMRTDARYLRMMGFHISDDTKPLASPGRITSRWHRIVLDDGDDDNADLQHKKRGRKVRLHKKGSVFAVRVHVAPQPQEARQTQTSWRGGRLCWVSWVPPSRTIEVERRHLCKTETRKRC